MLLIANSQNILATYLSGAPVPNITPTSAKQTTAMDFNYVEDTVCWVHVGDSASQTVLKCAKIPNLKGFVEERSINISLSLHRECPGDPRPAPLSPQFFMTTPLVPRSWWVKLGRRQLPVGHSFRFFVVIFSEFCGFLVCGYEGKGYGEEPCAAGFGMAVLASFGPTPKK